MSETNEPLGPSTNGSSQYSLKTKAFIGVGVLLLVVAITTVGVLYKQVTDLKKSPTAAADKEAHDIISAVGKHLVLPNETPTIATVADLSKLQDQPFYANAKNGDKVLIYATVKKAILYDPSIDRVVEVAPITIDTTDQGTLSGTSTKSATKK